MPLLWKKPGKEEGISCVIRARNEADWARLSIISILEFADEIIFVDNGSTDGTLELVKRLKEDAGIEKLRIFTFPEIDGKKIRVDHFYNFAFGKAAKSWLFKWDADFIARTEEPWSIMSLKELWKRKKKKTDLVRLSAPNLWGDHRHLLFDPPDDPLYCFERYLWRNRRWRFVMEGNFEKLVMKGRKKSLNIGPGEDPADHRVYFYHMKGLKPDGKIVERKVLGRWWKHCMANPSERRSFQEWKSDVYGTSDPEEQARLALHDAIKAGKAVPFKSVGGAWGDYPGLLKPYMENPKYEIIYENGKPARRVTHPEREVPLPEEFKNGRP